jgi:uncharacterized protein YndB with AHSA1/START domain
MTDLVIRRTLAVPRERVFAAWLEPETLVRFMKPGDVTSATAEVDARVGGKFRIVMEHGRGSAEHWGEYLAIDPPSLLSFTWTSASTDLEPTVVTIELFDRDGATELVLTHRRLPDRTAGAHRNGWTEIVRKLEGVLR